MFFQRIKTPGIAHNAYLIGNGGAAVVIDPRRDVGEYLAVARANGLSIRYVVETHRQEDFVLGSAALKEATGAEIVGGDHALFGREAGRTDLPDPLKTAENAGLLYDSVRAKIFPLGDQTLLFPAHGAGSVCGRNIAARDESTLGLEKSINPVWRMTRAAFMAHKQAERIPRPPYFSLMERLNIEGGMAVSARQVRVLQPAAFAAASRHGLVIDTRQPEAFAGGHVPRAYSIWLAGLSSFAGWIADDTVPVHLVLDDASQLETAVAGLSRIGVDRIEGFLAGGFAAWRDAGLPVATAGTIDAADLARDLPGYRVLDVREAGEYEESHIEGAVNVYVGELERQADALAHRVPRNRPVVVVCSVGNRASLGVSVLQRRGFEHVYNLLGGMTAWRAIGSAVQHAA